MKFHMRFCVQQSYEVLDRFSKKFYFLQEIEPRFFEKIAVDFFFRTAVSSLE